jgi:hypothetical protein
MLTEIRLPTQSNPAKYGPAGATRLVNCYVEDAGNEGKSKFPIYSLPGMDTWVSLSGYGIVRAAIVVANAIYLVAGQTALKVSSTGGVTSLGTVGGPDLTKLVTMDCNRVGEIGIVVDGFYYVIDTGSSDSFTNVTTNVLPNVIAFAVHDGYGVLLTDEGTFQLTGVDNATAVSALNSAAASADRDGGNMVAVRNRDLVLFGPNSVEFWQNTGDTFPYARSSSAVGEDAGLLAPGSVRVFAQTMAYIATDKTVRAIDGYTPTRVSTHAVERSIADDPSPELITSHAWTFEGHTRYQINGTDWSWIYDATLQAWFEAESYGIGVSRAGVYINYRDRHLFGGTQSGVLYERRKDYYTEAGNPLVWKAQLAPVHSFPNELKFNALHIDIMTGASPDPDLEPMLMLDWSDDGGATWSAQRILSLGRQGARRQTVTARRLGKAPPQGRIFRLSGSSASATCLLDVRPDVEALR